ncbi:MAG: branched-chain amino acid ABC transporter permease, partial [Gammaproteobacteria bacterium]
DHWQLTLGLAIIAFVALLPRGLIGLVHRTARTAKEPRT